MPVDMLRLARVVFLASSASDLTGGNFARRASKHTLLVCLAGMMIASSGCADARVNTGPREIVVEKSTSVESTEIAGQEKLTVSGVRLTKGNAVDCPQIRTDDGRTISVSYLAPAIAIGDRVEVTGFMVNKATCRGPVLNAESVRQLGN